ncbi:MAG: hypothetical protein ACOY4W_12520 [Thermodesulfobacteriota bacterium]
MRSEELGVRSEKGKVKSEKGEVRREKGEGRSRGGSFFLHFTSYISLLTVFGFSPNSSLLTPHYFINIGTTSYYFGKRNCLSAAGLPR